MEAKKKCGDLRLTPDFTFQNSTQSNPSNWITESTVESAIGNPWLFSQANVSGTHSVPYFGLVQFHSRIFGVTKINSTS
jgi:hypothetical protein